MNSSVDSTLPDLDCFQMHDVYLWISHVSRALVYFPNLVESYSGPQTTVATVVGRNSQNLATGPIIRATPRMMLLDGFQDSILGALGLGKIPPLVSNWTTPWPEAVNTGATDRDQFWSIEEYNGQAGISEWQGTTLSPSPVEGNYDGLRSPPGKDGLQSKASDMPLSMKVWVSSIKRYVTLYKNMDPATGDIRGAISGPHGKLDGLQRYGLFSEEVVRAAYGDLGGPTFPRYATDELFQAPNCMVSIRSHPEFVAAQIALGSAGQSTVSADAFASQPYLLACNESVRGLGAQGPTPS